MRLYYELTVKSQVEKRRHDLDGNRKVIVIKGVYLGTRICICYFYGLRESSSCFSKDIVMCPTMLTEFTAKILIMRPHPCSLDLARKLSLGSLQIESCKLTNSQDLRH